MKDLTYLEPYRQREYERRLYGVNGDEKNGVFKVFVSGKSFWCIASNGGGWEHISVTRRNGKIPTWEEMCAIKDMFFDAEEVVVQYHPKKSEYVNIHDGCLHLWRPTTVEMPTPPKIFV
jgi:peptide methionine sulfoxide reductase MsrA